MNVKIPKFMKLMEEYGFHMKSSEKSFFKEIADAIKTDMTATLEFVDTNKGLPTTIVRMNFSAEKSPRHRVAEILLNRGFSYQYEYRSTINEVVHVFKDIESLARHMKKYSAPSYQLKK